MRIFNAEESGRRVAYGSWPDTIGVDAAAQVRVHAILAVLFSVSAVQFIALGAGAIEFQMAHTLSDDAFYYLEIGRQVWESGTFPSFDGVTKTNGFHVLYQLLLIPLAPIYTLSLEHTYSVVIALNAGMFLVGSMLLWSLLDRFLPLRASLPCIAFVLLSTLTRDLVATGLEASLSYLLSMLLLWLLFCRRSAPWMIGMTLGLLVLARLDIGVLSALVVGTAYLVRALRERNDRRARRDLGVLVGSATLLVAPLVAFNMATFGHPTPISGATKMYVNGLDMARQGAGSVWLESVASYVAELAVHTLDDFARLPYALTFGRMASGDDIAALGGTVPPAPWLWGLTWLALGAVAWLGNWVLRRGDDASSAPRGPMLLWTMLLVVPAVHFVAVVVLLGKHAGTWYWLHLVVAAGVLLALVARRASRLGTLAGFALVLLALSGFVTTPAVMASVGAFSDGYRESSWYAGPYEAARWIDALDRDDVRVGSFNAGFLGYMTDAPVINLDGLANDYDYLEARREGSLQEYLVERGITHLSDIGAPDKYVDILELEEDEVELVYASDRGAGYVLELDLERARGEQ